MRPMVLVPMCAWLLAALSVVCAREAGPRWSFADTFGDYPRGPCVPDQSRVGPWFVAFAGYGCVAFEADGGPGWLHQAPRPSRNAAETHAALVLGPAFSGPLRLEAEIQTAGQLRTGSAPNRWEAGWLVWQYTDNQHFYYVILQPDGWELGKEDPAYPGKQRFLATGTAPRFAAGDWHTVGVSQDQQHTITVYGDGTLLASITDAERPYTAGNIGLYSEDAHVHLRSIQVAGARDARGGQP